MTVYIIVIAAYIALTAAIGIYSRKKVSTSESYMGSNLGLLLCVFAGAGEWMGGTSTTGVSEYGYLYGLSGAWYTIANGIGILFLAFCFAGLFRSLKKVTVSGIIGTYVGDKARFISSILLIIVMMIVGTSQMIAVGTLGQSLFGWNESVSILLFGILVIVYTFFGGIFSVGYTNILHLFCMYGGMLLALILLMSDIGGISGMQESLPSEYWSMGNIGGVKISSWLIASVLGACTAQAGIQPILAAKDEKTAVKSSVLIALIVAPFGILTALLGMIAKIKFPELSSAKLALPSLMLSLPAPAGAIVMAAMLAAIFSTASPIFLACGTLFANDIFPKIRRTAADDSSVLRNARGFTLFAGAVCILIAAAFYNSAMVLDIVYFAYSIRGSIFVILLLGIYWKKTSQNGVCMGLVLTLIVGCFWVIYKSIYGVYPLIPWFSETYVSVLTALISTLIFSRLFPNRKKL